MKKPAKRNRRVRNARDDRRVARVGGTRKTARKRRNWFAPFGILFTLGAVYYTKPWARGVSLPRFPALAELAPAPAIRGVRVVGASALLAPDLAKLSGLAKGGAFTRQKTEDALAKLNKHPRLAQVSIVKDVTGDVLIKVRERAPVALIQLDRLHYLDNEGRILDQADSADVASMAVVTGEWKPREETGMAVTAMKLRQTLVDGGMDEKKISELHYDASAGWTLYPVETKIPVVFGLDRFEEKTERMMGLFKRFKGRESAIEEIDLDYEKRAVIKLKRRKDESQG